MQAFTAYRSNTGQAFRTPEACLHAEFDDLRETVIAWAHALIVLPDLDIDQQFQTFFEKVDQWHAKGQEYKQALEAVRRPKPENLAEFRQEYKELVLKTGTDHK